MTTFSRWAVTDYTSGFPFDAASPKLLVAAALAAVLIYLTTHFRSQKSPPSWVNELPMLGVPRAQKLLGTAVVCGGSVSGILAARVLADNFESVILIDPEFSRAQDGRHKSRIAQYDSTHTFLSLFLSGLRRFWPTVESEVEKAGGINRSADYRLHYGGTRIPTPYSVYPAGAFPTTSLITRPVFEPILQRLLLRSSPNVRVVDGTVKSIVPSSKEKNRLEAVVVKLLGGGEDTITGVSLVVDCTGNNQSGMKWLESAGYPIPKTTRISYDQKLRYLTVAFRVPEALRDTPRLPLPEGFDNSGTLYAFGPRARWSGAGIMLAKSSADTITACCMGYGHTVMPTNKDQIMDHIRRLTGSSPVPEWVVTLVQTLQDECELVTFKPLRISPRSYVQYHDVPDLPANFIAMGDATMQLNPMFGQGCSKAMLCAITLNAMLASLPSTHGKKDILPADFGSTYFSRMRAHCEILWDATKALDYGFSTTVPVAGESRTNLITTLSRWFGEQIAFASITDTDLSSKLWHSQMLLTPSSELATPSVVFRVIRSWASDWFAGRSQ